MTRRSVAYAAALLADQPRRARLRVLRRCVVTASRTARVETPADTLRRAAAKVRATKRDVADAWPWRSEGTLGVVGADGLPVCDEVAFGTQQWIALVSPAVAEPLAAWLVDTAAAIELRSGAFAELAPPNWATSALIFARALLGSLVPEPDGEGTA